MTAGVITQCTVPTRPVTGPYMRAGHESRYLLVTLSC